MGIIKDWLFGGRYKTEFRLQINLIEERLNIISTELATVEDHLKALDEIVLRIVEISPGEGWPQAVQNAVANLDTRAHNLELVTDACAKMLEHLTGGESGNNVFIFPQEVDKRDLQ